MILLLVVGLAAVILVILIAVFLSLRLGRSDDHEEPEGRLGERSRDRHGTEDARWRDRDRHQARRPSSASARNGGPDGQRTRAEAEPDRRYRDRDERREREQARPREYDYPPRRGERYDTGPLEHPSDPRRPVAAGARRTGSGRDQPARRSASGRDRHDANAAALYDTGPAARPAADDFPSGPFPATDFPSGELPSGPLPVADFPSGPFPATDFASGEFPSGPLPVADFPSGEMPAARGRGRSAAADDGDRPEQRRKPAKGQSSAKGRSRQQRGKRDDDDWPSMEWDKLSDEQYWAELSSDKPLATTARTPQAASEAKPAAAKNGQSRAGAAKPRPGTADPAPAPPAAAEPGPGRDLPSRKSHSSQQREAVTERLPIRSRQQPAAPGRASDSPPPARPGNGRPASEPSLAMLASLASAPPGRPPGALDEDPLTSPSFARPTVDSRSYQSARKNPQGQDTGGHQHLDSPPAGAGYGGNGYGTGGYEATGYDDGSGYPNGSGHSAADAAAYTPAGGTYQPPDYTTTAYAYPPAPAAQASPPPVPAQQPAGWYGAPDEPAVPQGNPYGSYVEPAQAGYPTIPPAGYEPQQHAGSAYPGYPAGYAEPPAYDQAAALPYQSVPSAGVPVPPAADTQFPPPGSYPEAGYAGAGGYPQEHAQAAYDAYGSEAYTPGYPDGYAADPYGHDGYGGYPASQG
jgi:hypothetical protein